MRVSAWMYGVLAAVAFVATTVPVQAGGQDVSPPGWAISRRPADAPLTVRQFDKIHGQVQMNGTARVIVRLRDAATATSFQNDANLDRKKAEEQKKALGRVQDNVLGKLKTKAREKAKKFSTIPFMAVEVDEADFSEILNSPEVDLVEEDVPSPPDLSQSVPLVGGDGSSSFGGFTGAGQAVAILDTGVDKTHPFLTGKVVEEACYSTTYGTTSYSVCPNGQNAQTGAGSGVNCNTAISGCTHGTHVAGIAAGNNGSGLTGVAKDASVIAIQVFANFPNSANCGSNPAPCALSWSSDQLAALERVYALRTTYNIASVNMSLGGGSYTATCDANNAALKAAIDNLRAVGIATVIATGNNGYTNAISSPACISTAVSVGSTTKSDTVASYSNSASFFHLLAPGSSIYSSTPGGYYASWNGTSMATPHVAGAWAVIKSKKPAATVDEVLTALISTGQTVTDSRNSISKPRIKVAAALATISGTNVAVSLAPSVASPREIGTPITFTATATGDAGPYDYEFYTLAPSSGTWVKTQPYSSSNTWTWNYPNIAGTWQVKVLVRKNGTTPSAGYDSFATANYTITGSPVTTVTLSANPASPQFPGTSVTFTATPTGSYNAAYNPYSYEFWMLAPGGTWTKKSTNVESNSWVWNTTGLAAGTYQVQARVKTNGTSPASGYDAAGTINYVISDSKPSGITVTPNAASPQVVGTSITFTAACSGGQGPFSYEFYSLAPGAATWVKQQAYSSTATLTWNTTGLATGTYQFSVWGKTTGTTPTNGSYDQAATFSYTITNPPAVSGITVTPSAASPQITGTTVTFTASASGGTGTYNYEFWLLPPGGSWTKKQAYSATNAWAFNSTGLATGTYQLMVWAKSSGTTPANGSYDQAATINYTINPVPAASGVTITPNVASPQITGANITFTAAGAGGNGNYDYEFYLLSPGSATWVKKQAYSSAATWTFSTAGLPTGTYQISAWVKTSGTTPANGSYDKTASVTYTITPPPPATTLTVTPSAASPQVTGATVTFTAAASGGTGTYDYEFWLLAPGGAWTKKQAYSGTTSWALNTTGLATGTYQLSVWAKSSGTTPANGSYDQATTVTYTINPIPAASGVTVSPSAASPQITGASITFTAAGAGGNGSYDYEFWMLSPGSATWVKKQAYSSTATWTWNTAGLPTGTYQISAWVKTSGTTPANGSYDKAATISYNVTPIPAATAITAVPSVASPQVKGTTVTFSAAASGGTGTYDYEFYLLPPGGTWTKKQAYSTTATWAWDTTGAATGTYQISVWSKSSGTTPANGSYDQASTLSYTVSPPPAASGVTVTPSLASPQITGATVTFTAAGSGGTGSYDYEFYLQSPGGGWVKKQAYSSTATWTFNTTGLPTGTYQVSVWVKSSGTTPANGAYDQTGTIAYNVTPIPAATALTVTPSVASPQTPGGNITFTASASGGTGTYDYEFYYLAPGAGWVKKQAYSNTNTWTWSTAGLPAGTYQISVWAKSAGTSPANGSYDRTATVSFVINALPPSTGISATPSVASPQAVGTAVTFTGAGAGGTGTYDYEFYLLSPGSATWVKKQAYSNTATWTWNTVGLPPGTYQICVWVKTTGSTPANGSFDKSAAFTYTIQ